MAYLSLSTANLPDPVIDPAAGEEATEYFGTLLWSGDDNATRTIQSGGSGVTGDINFTPDFAWVKRRNGASNGSDHMLLDVVRGVGSFNALSCNGSQAEGLTAAGSSWVNFGDINAFTTDGFTVQKGSDSSHTLEGINQSGGTYVGWSWKAGGTAVSNTDGSITSSVSANTTSGMSVVKYDGTGTAATVGHGLDQAPQLIFCKRLDRSGDDWKVYAEAIGGGTHQLTLNSTANASTNSAQWNDTDATSTVFSIGTSAATNGTNQVAYCFHSVDSYSLISSYVGNGNSDGSFVYCGFRPSWLMVKKTDGAGVDGWTIVDNKRDTFNVMDQRLQAQSSDAEGGDVDLVDFVSNGFKIRYNGQMNNQSGTTYLFYAVSENPFKYSNAR